MAIVVVRSSVNTDFGKTAPRRRLGRIGKLALPCRPNGKQSHGLLASAQQFDRQCPSRWAAGIDAGERCPVKSGTRLEGLLGENWNALAVPVELELVASLPFDQLCASVAARVKLPFEREANGSRRPLKCHRLFEAGIEKPVGRHHRYLRLCPQGMGL